MLLADFFPHWAVKWGTMRWKMGAVALLLESAAGEGALVIEDGIEPGGHTEHRLQGSDMEAPHDPGATWERASASQSASQMQTRLKMAAR